MNVALTVALEEREMTQVPVPEQLLPVQPANVEPEPGAADRVTEVPCVKEVKQVAPQLIPAGELVTVPVPDPLFMTVRFAVPGGGGGGGGVVALKVAVRVFEPLVEMMHCVK